MPDSTAHPFHVARFANQTAALLERGPIAISEAGAFFGQDLLEALPDAATATVPSALERALAVDRSPTTVVESARLLTMLRGEFTLERFNVVRKAYRVRIGVERATRVLMRHPPRRRPALRAPRPGRAARRQRPGARRGPAHERAEVIVTTRRAFTDRVEVGDHEVVSAIAQYLHEA
jgi:hypothetical protein